MRFRPSELKKVHAVIVSYDPKTLHCEKCNHEWHPATKKTVKGPVLFGDWFKCPECHGEGKQAVEIVETKKRGLGRPKGGALVRPHHDEIVEAVKEGKYGYQRALAKKFGVSGTAINRYIRNNIKGPHIVDD